MFDTLPGHWLPATSSSAVGDRPVAVTVAGERLVVFRDGTGAARTLVDRCPHRGVALSLGRRTADGCLECPFHGWRFDGSGRCLVVPLDPNAKTSILGAIAIPTYEGGGLVWVFTDPSAPDPGTPHIPEMLAAEGLSVRHLERTWRCHWTRAMENMLDAPHLPFVHSNTIGRGFPDPLTVSLAFDVEELPSGFRLRWWTEPGERSGDAWLEWSRPVGMVLNIPAGPIPYRQHVFCVPGAAGETRMMVLSAMRLPTGLGWASSVAGAFERRILEEDRAVVESSDPPEVPPPGAEASVASDRPTLIFRSWYHRHVRRADAVDAPSAR